jgi:hypothetical protein
VRKDIIRRDHTNDWIADAEKQNVITPDEAKALKELEGLVAQVIAVDHFDAGEVTPNFKKTDTGSLAAE